MRRGGIAGSSRLAAGREVGGAGWPSDTFMGADCDADLGRLFQDARTHMRLTREELAYRLGTTEHIVAVFEAGAIGGLPSWPETRRVVEAYAGLVRFDPGPLLAHLEAHVRAQASRALRPIEPSIANVPAQVPAQLLISQAPAAIPVPQPRGIARQVGWRAWGRFWPTIVASALVLGLAVGFYWAAFARPPVLMASINMLPAAMAGPVRSAMDGVVALSAPRRDGLRWIEVDDPRTRKADKLRINAE